MDYGKEIIVLLNEIKEERILKFIYDLIISFKEKWSI